MAGNEGGITRREMMTGLGVGAGALAGIAVGVPLTAVAAPVTAHLPAWGSALQDLSTPLANLTYLNIDGAAFHVQNGDRYLDSLTGVGVGGNATSGWLIAPLSLAAGSVVRQVNIGYVASADLLIQIVERDFLSASNEAWNDVVSLTAPGGSGGRSATLDLPSPVTIEHGKSYTLQINIAAAGQSVRGVTVAYVPPTAGFVPFAGSDPRVLDTRNGGGKVGNNGEILVALGNSGVRGALLNVTVTDTEGLGFAAVFDASINYPGNSSVNWAAPGATVANGVVSAVAANGRVKIRVGGTPDAAAHIIVDRLGWFI